jgi:hypothetical protein
MKVRVVRFFDTVGNTLRRSLSCCRSCWSHNDGLVVDCLKEARMKITFGGRQVEDQILMKKRRGHRKYEYKPTPIVLLYSAPKKRE